LNHPPRFLSLEVKPRCPNRRCKRFVFEIYPDRYDGALKCPRCSSRWWAFRLSAGNVRQQLLDAFEGDEAVVDTIMALYDVPLELSRPMFWQIWLSGNEFYRFNKDQESSTGGRSLALLRRLATLLRPTA
jgi:hypothetical protein